MSKYVQTRIAIIGTARGPSPTLYSAHSPSTVTPPST